MSAQVIFLPPFPISYEEARRNQNLQDKIAEQRARINNWSRDKSPCEVAQAWIAWRKLFRKQVFMVQENHFTKK